MFCTVSHHDWVVLIVCWCCCCVQDQIPPEARGRDRYRASTYRGYVWSGVLVMVYVRMRGFACH